jgi:hypothetical protein
MYDSVYFILLSQYIFQIFRINQKSSNSYVISFSFQAEVCNEAHAKNFTSTVLFKTLYKLKGSIMILFKSRTLSHSKLK